MNIFLLIGITIAAGLFSGKIFRKIRSPQVVGYIVIGAVIGVSGFKLLDAATFEKLAPINNFALGLIGFMIGRELKFSVFQKLGKTIFTILFFEVIGAFLIVTLGVWLITRKLYIALVFGALATATAPAATVDVLWESNARGVLTTTIFSIVALDDVLALFVYAFAVSYAKALLNHSSMAIMAIVFIPLIEITASILLGIVIGFVLGKMAEKIRSEKRYLPLILAGIMICIGLAKQFHLSQILSCMVLGMTLANMRITRSQYAFKVIEDITEPIYIIFFVLIGSQLQIAKLPSMGLLGLVYIAARMIGKIGGTKIGAKISQAETVVGKYLGMALFSQAGIAIGLALAVHNQFSHFGPQGKHLGELVINVIMATTFVVQIIGPPCVKYAITKAGEVDMAARRPLT